MRYEQYLAKVRKSNQMKTVKKGRSRELNKYYKEIAKALPRKGKKTLLPHIKAGVEDYLAENPEATIDDVVSYAGTPEDISAEYYATQEGTKITKEIKSSRLIKSVVLAIVLSALVIYMGFMLYTLLKHVLYLI